MCSIAHWSEQVMSTAQPYPPIGQPGSGSKPGHNLILNSEK